MPPSARQRADDEALRRRGVDLTRAADVTPGHDQLHHYWTKGKGLAKWHDFTSLYNHLVKYVGPARAKRMAAQWFHERFGFWPGSDKNRLMHGKKPRGHVVGKG